MLCSLVVKPWAKAWAKASGLVVSGRWSGDSGTLGRGHCSPVLAQCVVYTYMMHMHMHMTCTCDMHMHMCMSCTCTCACTCCMCMLCIGSCGAACQPTEAACVTGLRSISMILGVTPLNAKTLRESCSASSLLNRLHRAWLSCSEDARRARRLWLSVLMLPGPTRCDLPQWRSSPSLKAQRRRIRRAALGPAVARAHSTQWAPSGTAYLSVGVPRCPEPPGGGAP